MATPATAPPLKLLPPFDEDAATESTLLVAGFAPGVGARTTAELRVFDASLMLVAIASPPLTAFEISPSTLLA
jgi:hypothetical protein